MLAGFRSAAIESRHFALAGERYVAAPPNGLRAGDALHLAIVIDRGFTMATLDKQLAEASRQQGVEVASILEP